MVQPQDNISSSSPRFNLLDTETKILITCPKILEIMSTTIMTYIYICNELNNWAFIFYFLTMKFSKLLKIKFHHFSDSFKIKKKKEKGSSHFLLYGNLRVNELMN